MNMGRVVEEPAYSSGKQVVKLLHSTQKTPVIYNTWLSRSAFIGQKHIAPNMKSRNWNTVIQKVYKAVKY